MVRAMRLAALIAACAVLPACGSDGAGSPTDASDLTGDASPTDGSLTDAACTTPAACDWLEAYQREVVGKLAGAQEIAPGVTLAHRASAAEREHARVYLLAELDRLGIPAERHTYRASGTNVVGTLAPADGTPAGAGLIVIGAHLDSVAAGPGAADNATGVSIVLAAARYLREVPGRRHPVAFVLFDEEELGLIGSKAYAARLVTEQVPVAAVHAFDMLSYDMDGDRAIELWSPVAALEAAYREHGLAAGVPIQPVTFSRSDHQAFLDRGLPAVGIGEEFAADDHTPHYHQATDTYDRIDFTYLTASTRFALGVIEAGVTAP